MEAQSSLIALMECVSRAVPVFRHFRMLFVIVFRQMVTYNVSLIQASCETVAGNRNPQAFASYSFVDCISL